MLLVHRLLDLTLSSAIDPFSNVINTLTATTKAASTRAEPSVQLVNLMEKCRPWLTSSETGRIVRDGQYDENLHFKYDNGLSVILKEAGPVALDWQYPKLMAYLCFERADGKTIVFIDPDGRCSFFLTDEELALLRQTLKISSSSITDFSAFGRGKEDVLEDLYSWEIIKEYLNNTEVIGQPS